MNTTSRRGQAILEYFFTYGWAFLAVLVTVGALAYYGVFNLDTLRGDECLLPPGMACDEFVIDDQTVAAQPALTMVLRNTFGVQIEVSDMNVTHPIFGTVGCDMRDPATNATSVMPVTWAHEERFLVTCDLPGAQYDRGERYEFTWRAGFIQTGNSYVHNITGVVAAVSQ